MHDDDMMMSLMQVLEEKQAVGSQLAALQLQSSNRVDSHSGIGCVSGGVVSSENKELTLLKAENAALQRSIQSE